MGILDDSRLPDYLALFPKLHRAREAAMLEHLNETGMGLGDSRVPDYTALAATLRAGTEALGLKHLLSTQPPGGGGNGGGGTTTTSAMRGMNLPINQAYASFVPFGNVIHKSREWTIPGSRNLAPVDDLGVPTEAAETIVLQDAYPAGLYIYSGCELQGSGVISAADGVATLSGTGIVQATTPGNVTPVLMLPVELLSEGQRWNTTAISQLSAARIDCLRVMHWQRATYAGGDNPRWGFDPVLSERLTPAHTRWSAAPGVPWEVVVDFIRSIGAKRVWLTPPLLSPDDYLAEMAAIFSPLIDEGVEVIVEDSNEVWNSQFPANQLAINLASGSSPMPDAEGYGLDAARTCAQLQRAFGSRPWKFALMGHSIRSEWLKTAIASARSAGLMKLDYVGCSGYLPAPLSEWRQLDQATQVAYSTDQVVDDLRKGLPKVAGFLAAHKALAVEEGAELAIYEAAPIAITGTAGGGTLPIAGAATRAYRSAAWGDLWTELADEIKSHGPAIVCWFNWMNPVDEQNGSVGFYENHSTISPMGSAFLDYTG